MVMLSLCMVFTAMCTTKLSAEAEGAVTYTLRVVDGEWRYQPNYPWDDTQTHRELYYMKLALKDGDKIVVSDATTGLELTVDKKLSDLTVEYSNYAIITAPAYENVHVINNSLAAINGDVKNGYVYEASTVNFNNNVDYLEVSARFPLKANVAVVGTVNHLKAQDTERVHYEYYNFVPGKLSFIDGELKTDAAYYSTTAGATVVATTVPANTNNASSADELDDVPKTGDTKGYYWMLALAAVCMAGGLYLKKKDA